MKAASLNPSQVNTAVPTKALLTPLFLLIESKSLSGKHGRSDFWHC
ncbi:MAG: hypothetical protein KC449_30845 [Anaerolineales bacterium]|nr:hypothetical protein [Anaerolineales bacterium]